MIKFVRHSAVAALLALSGSVLAAVPAAASDGGSDVFEGIPDDTPPGQTAADEGNRSSNEEPPGDVIEELAPEAPPGPVGFTGASTFDVVWAPGDRIPSGFKVLTGGDDVQMVPFSALDELSFGAFLVIESAKAPTEYRFENAIPAGYRAELLDDGSIRLEDSLGGDAGLVSAPWAYDSSGSSLGTQYRVEGTTLVQTIEHQGAAYPVVADPRWWETAASYAGAAAAGATVACALTFCGAAVVTTIVVVGAAAAGVTVVGQMVPPSNGLPGNRPTNACNGRNRTGC